MIILNFGIPRSGTVWAFNVFRKIWERQGVAFETESPNSCAAVDDCVTGLDLTRNVIIHGHDVTPKLIQLAAHPEVRPFFNYRDPRDVVVSQIRLHDVPLENAIEMTAAAYRSLSKAICLPGIMVIPFAHIAEHAEPLIFQMATRLGILLKLGDVKTIAEETSARQHKQIMQNVAEPESSADSGSVATAHLATREIRYDEKHLITDRHIQSGKNGRWREELDATQQAEVQQRFAQLVDVLGFDA